MSEQEQRRLMTATILAGMLAGGAADGQRLPRELMESAIYYADGIIARTTEPKE